SPKQPGNWGENEERKPESFLRHDASEALKNQDIFGRGFQNGHTFSSQGRYNHFDTAACLAGLLYPIAEQKASRRLRNFLI
ncbi:MAG: hypothetical protein IJT62_08025, partial [Oscillospiraceae bacterium]|nr:hypothetical protein [Oscillospiraceae bacterium]